MKFERFILICVPCEHLEPMEHSTKCKHSEETMGLGRCCVSPVARQRAFIEQMPPAVYDQIYYDMLEHYRGVTRENACPRCRGWGSVRRNPDPALYKCRKCDGSGIVLE